MRERTTASANSDFIGEGSLKFDGPKKRKLCPNCGILEKELPQEFDENLLENLWEVEDVAIINIRKNSVR